MKLLRTMSFRIWNKKASTLFLLHTSFKPFLSSRLWNHRTRCSIYWMCKRLRRRNEEMRVAGENLPSIRRPIASCLSSHCFSRTDTGNLGKPDNCSLFNEWGDDRNKGIVVLDNVFNLDNFRSHREDEGAERKFFKQFEGPSAFGWSIWAFSFQMPAMYVLQVENQLRLIIFRHRPIHLLFVCY